MSRLWPAGQTYHGLHSGLRPARRARSGVWLGFWLLLAGVLVALPVAAAGPVAVPQGPLPIDELKPVECSFMAIDATISAIEGGIALETRTRTRLKNPEKKASFERQVSFGLPVGDVKIGTQNGGLHPAEGSGPWLLTLGPDGDAVIEGIQRLSSSGPLAELQFDWAALRPWGSRLDSVRLTLHFPGDLQAEQLLVVEPAPTERDTVRLTWSYEKFEPDGKVRVLFIGPPYWRAVRKARQATSGPQAGAADYLALAAALHPLAVAEGMPAAIANGLQAELLWALRRAVAAGPQDARAHQELAAYLSAQAKGSPALLAETVSELKAAYDLAPSDAGLKVRLLAALDELMAACRQAGDTRGLLAALDVVEAVEPQGSQERAAAYADLAVGLIEAGRLLEAEATIVAGFGQPALDRYAFCRPHFSSVVGEIETRSGQRRMRFTLVPAPGREEAAEQDLATLDQALARIEVGQVRRGAGDGQTIVDVTVPFTAPEGLRATGGGLGGAMPAEADPAVLLVAAAAGPASLEFRASRELQADRLIYAESADLAPAQDSLDRRLEQLRSARLEAEAPTADPLEAARRRWALALLRQYEADWQALAAGCRVTYRLLPSEDIVTPEWALAWGEQRSLAWSTSIPRLERLLPYGIGLGAGLLVLLVGLVLWQWTRRDR